MCIVLLCFIANLLHWRHVCVLVCVVCGVCLDIFIYTISTYSVYVYACNSIYMPIATTLKGNSYKGERKVVAQCQQAKGGAAAAHTATYKYTVSLHSHTYIFICVYKNDYTCTDYTKR